MTKLPKKITEVELELFFYENTCDNLARAFVKKYFGEEADYYWIGDERGHVIEVADRFFDIKKIYAILKARLSKRKMFTQYDQELKDYEKVYKMQKNKRK